MRVASLLLTTALLGGVPVPAQGPAWAATLRQRLGAPRFAGARWGVQVVSLASGQVLFEQDADKFFTPASTAKLFPAALALATLGPEFRIRTSVYASRPPGPDGRTIRRRPIRRYSRCARRSNRIRPRARRTARSVPAG